MVLEELAAVAEEEVVVKEGREEVEAAEERVHDLHSLYHLRVNFGSKQKALDLQKEGNWKERRFLHSRADSAAEGRYIQMH